MIRKFSNKQRVRLSSLYYFVDDFIGNTYDTRFWSVRGTGGSASIQAGGVLRLRATANLYYELYQGDMGDFSVAAYGKCTWRFRVSSLTSISGRIGFESNTNPSTHWACLILDPTLGTSNWYCQSADGGAATSTDSAVAADTNYHEFTLETSPGALNYWLDGTLLTTKTTNVTTDNLQLYAYTQSRTGSTRDVFVDFVEATGNRS